VSSPLSILIVEDEPLIALMLEDFLDSLGHSVVGTVDCVTDAMEKVEEGGFDLAILDVHLRGGERGWPIADRLVSKGVPFVLATGGHVDPPPPEHSAAPVLTKPFTIDAIKPALDAACGASA
jgi:CheY-like chemotaxis protein